jgi:hypothetical protein
VPSMGHTPRERVRELGVEPGLEPFPPKMGFMVLEAAARAAALRNGER